jgi:hypothetical protein
LIPLLASEIVPYTPMISPIQFSHKWNSGENTPSKLWSHCTVAYWSDTNSKINAKGIFDSKISLIRNHAQQA